MDHKLEDGRNVFNPSFMRRHEDFFPREVASDPEAPAYRKGWLEYMFKG